MILHQPLISLLKMPTIKPTSTSTQWTRMNTQQNTMPLLIHLSNPLSRRCTPSQEHNTPRSLRRHNIYDLLRELLPASVRMGIRLMGSNRQAGIEEQDSAIGPRCEKTSFVGWRGEGGIVVFQTLVDVCEGGRCGGWWADGEGKAMGLVYIVVGILAEDYSFDCIERRVAGPGVSISSLFISFVVFVQLSVGNGRTMGNVGGKGDKRTKNIHPQQEERSSSPPHVPSSRTSSTLRIHYSSPRPSAPSTSSHGVSQSPTPINPSAQHSMS
jgi:hypothetical protein